MTRRLRIGLIGALATVGVIMALASFSASRPLLVWNFTASAPIGLYQTFDRPWARGDWVAVEPSAELRTVMARLGVLEDGRLLVKQVAAAEGDEVCRQGLVVTINHVQRAIARAETSDGARLPSWEGCRQLTADEVFLLGQSDGSFDGRYFGPISSRGIVAPIAPVWRLGDQSNAE